MTAMWYFTDAEEKLRYDDGRKISLGTTHRVKCEPILCKQGLHASPTVLDAVGYAPGNILYRVELSGTIVHGDDKSCATERTYLARIDAEPILRAFARRVALDVAHFWDCPPIVREFLETGDESKSDAAWAAAWAASAGSDAARAASAGSDAAWAAARAASAGSDAASAAARAAIAGSDAAWAASAGSAAASAAAGAAARPAARPAASVAKFAEYKALLDKMVTEAMAAAPQ